MAEVTQKQNNQPWNRLTTPTQKFFAYFFTKKYGACFFKKNKVGHLQCSYTKTNIVLIFTLTQKFFAYFFTKKYGDCFFTKNKVGIYNAHTEKQTSF